MPFYTVRVQLDGYPSTEKYERLHAVMATYGMLRENQGMRLPHGTYCGNNNVDAVVLRDAIADSAKQINAPKDAEIFVSETTNWAQRGYPA